MPSSRLRNPLTDRYPSSGVICTSMSTGVVQLLLLLVCLLGLTSATRSQYDLPEAVMAGGESVSATQLLVTAGLLAALRLI